VAQASLRDAQGGLCLQGKTKKAGWKGVCENSCLKSASMDPRLRGGDSAGSSGSISASRASSIAGRNGTVGTIEKTETVFSSFVLNRLAPAWALSEALDGISE